MYIVMMTLTLLSNLSLAASFLDTTELRFSLECSCNRSNRVAILVRDKPNFMNGILVSRICACCPFGTMLNYTVCICLQHILGLIYRHTEFIVGFSPMRPVFDPWHRHVRFFVVILVLDK